MTIDMRGGKLMTLGIRRDTDDIDGKKYLATKMINE
jgi:hypothetical protein